MTIQIKKLIEHIDQLVHWLKENPNTPIPSIQKGRLTAVVNRILSSEELTEEEWEKLKPAILNSAHKPGTKNASKTSKRLPSRIVDIKIGEKLQKAFQEAIEKSKQLQPQELNSTVIERVMVKCPNCNCNVLQKNLKRHKKKCTSILRRGQKSTIEAAKSNENKMFENQNSRSNNDGSYGFHQFRETGRFGSYPSFDNMSDESHP